MLDQILKWLSISCLLFLVFLAGIVAAINKTYFYWKVQEVYLYLDAREEEMELRKDHNYAMFFPVEHQFSGVTLHDSSQSMPGLTFFTDATPSAYLIGSNGNIVHKWHFPYDKAFPEGGRDPRRIYWHGVYLFPDSGDLLAIYENPYKTPYGSGLIKIDKDSNLLWRYEPFTHHELDVAPDGTLYVIVHTVDKVSPEGMDHIRPPFLHDHIAALTASGHEIKRVSVLKALQNSEFHHYLQRLPQKKGDYTHVNSIKYVTPELAQVFPMVKTGSVFISIPKINAIAAIDIEQEKVVWIKTMPWGPLHTLHLLPNGNMLLFANYGTKGIKSNSRSAVVEYDPKKDTIVWSYEGNKEHPMFTEARGGVNLLPNGNLLISESDKGRLLEITREGHKTWEYYTPLRKQNNNISTINSAARYQLEELLFLTENP